MVEEQEDDDKVVVMVGGGDDESNEDEAEGKEDRPVGGGGGGKMTGSRREFCSTSVPFQRVTLVSLIIINISPLKLNESTQLSVVLVLVVAVHSI